MNFIDGPEHLRGPPIILSRLFLKKIDWNPKHLIAWRHIRFENKEKDKDKKTYKDVMIYLARRNDTKELVYDMFSTDNPDKLAPYGTLGPKCKHKTYYGTICDVNSKFAKEHKNEVKEDYWKGNTQLTHSMLLADNTNFFTEDGYNKLLDNAKATPIPTPKPTPTPTPTPKPTPNPTLPPTPVPTPLYTPKYKPDTDLILAPQPTPKPTPKPKPTPTPSPSPTPLYTPKYKPDTDLILAPQPTPPPTPVPTPHNTPAPKLVKVITPEPTAPPQIPTEKKITDVVPYVIPETSVVEAEQPEPNNKLAIPSQHVSHGSKLVSLAKNTGLVALKTGGKLAYYTGKYGGKLAYYTGKEGGKLAYRLAKKGIPLYAKAVYKLDKLGLKLGYEMAKGAIKGTYKVGKGLYNVGRYTINKAKEAKEIYDAKHQKPLPLPTPIPTPIPAKTLHTIKKEVPPIDYRYVNEPDADTRHIWHYTPPPFIPNYTKAYMPVYKPEKNISYTYQRPKDYPDPWDYLKEQPKIKEQPIKVDLPSTKYTMSNIPQPLSDTYQLPTHQTAPPNFTFPAYSSQTSGEFSTPPPLTVYYPVIKKKLP